MSTESLPSGIREAEHFPEPPFYISATGSSTRPRYTMKHDDSFLVLDNHGDIGASAGGPDGLFHMDTRHLAHFELLINGLQPLLLGSNLTNDNGILTVDLTNPDIFYNNHIILQKNLLHVARTVFVWRGTIYNRFAVLNYSAQRVQLLLSFTFDNDFADVFEVRGMTRTRRGAIQSEIGDRQVALVYAGLDNVTRRTEIAFDPPPTHLSLSLASFRLDLDPQKAVSLHASVSCNTPAVEPTPFLKIMRRAHLEIKQVMDVDTEIHTSNHLFN